MKKIMLLCAILMISVMTSACINNLAVQELNNKAEAYLNSGDTETAICRLKSSLDLDDEIYQTHYNLAAAYIQIGNYEDARLEADKVLKLKPDLYDAYYLIASAEEASAYKTIAGGLNETDAASVSEFIIKAQNAVDYFNKYLSNVPNAPETRKINEKITELNNKIKEYTQNSLINENSQNTKEQEQTEVKEQEIQQ